MNKLNGLKKENELVIKEKHENMKTENVWALDDYRIIATMLLPVSTHLTSLSIIQLGDSVLDIACGNGNTAICS